ncbi:DUF493 family protein [Bergeyella sp. RCAD1439]|uniref:DUF493 family protein n=1 Tax=Bergeyella anatis TaxID=3113737 RepID=UPI002E1811F9|nr:DUF493 family protein [Bergeyella sp. RCAD1439]
MNINPLDQSIKNDPEAFYASLKTKLEENHNFPEDYLYKFIFPNENAKLTELYQIFDKIDYTISTRESKNGKYISASIQAFVMDADQVINLYKKVAEIDGVVML